MLVEMNTALVMRSSVLISVSLLQHARAASVSANAAPHFYEQCISGERRSYIAGAVSRKANAALSVQSGVLLRWTPSQE